MINLQALAYELREYVIDMIAGEKAGHIGGDMSVMKVLTELCFNRMNIGPENMDDPDRDKFVMSKGHSVEAYYAVLAGKGFLTLNMSEKNLVNLVQNLSDIRIISFPDIEMNCGSLGHGLPICVGMALAGKMSH